MSQWTHVAGVVRVDGMGMVLGMTPIDEEQAIEKVMGKTVSYDSPKEEWDKCTVPCGSEGSLQYKVDIHGTRSSLYRGTVTIWGDLRDYDNVNELVSWFKKVIGSFNISKDFPFGIRDAVMSIDVEGSSNRVICYWNDKELMTKEVRNSEDRKQDMGLGRE